MKSLLHPPSLFQRIKHRSHHGCVSPPYLRTNTVRKDAPVLFCRVVPDVSLTFFKQSRGLMEFQKMTEKPRLSDKVRARVSQRLDQPHRCTRTAQHRSWLLERKLACL
jgi:hypothetical protein